MVTTTPNNVRTETTKEMQAQHDQLLASLPFADKQDFANADRGFIAALDPMVIKNAEGRVVWDMNWQFLDADCPETANPSLWRQAQLTAKHGLYEVADGIYQIRGFDMSNMTLVESDTGVIVIDPLISAEVAAAALSLYRDHRGDRPVTAIIYTHPHLDHFGGVLGVVSLDTKVPIYAPEHFLEHAVAENVYAGTAMLRRGYYIYGGGIPKSPTGTLGVGLGAGGSTGTVGLLAPTRGITHTGQEEVIDGVRLQFQMTRDTEAPVEMNFLFPDKGVLCMAENATHNMHNILTLRGAEVRDARMWSRYLAEAIELFADRADVAFASHHWPTWGQDAIKVFLSDQRDLYAYLHDQTLRLANQGYIGSEIAEMLEMPPGLAKKWYNRGYYGSLSHNVKAIYQRYMGWYDGNPAHLWQHPPESTAVRYVEVIGGVDATVAKVREYADRGDLRFAAELASHAVFASPENEAARAMLASVLEQLGYGAENATWRNCYLVGAHELRAGKVERTYTNPAGLAPALTTTQLFDSIAIRLNGPRAWNETLSVNWYLTDEERHYRMELRNGALVHYPSTKPAAADVSLTLARVQLLGLLLARKTDGVTVEGDAGVLAKLMSLLDEPDPNFAVATP